MSDSISSDVEKEAFLGLVEHWNIYFSQPETERGGSVKQWNCVILFGLGDLGIKGMRAIELNLLAQMEAQMCKE